MRQPPAGERTSLVHFCWLGFALNTPCVFIPLPRDWLGKKKERVLTTKNMVREELCIYLLYCAA